MPEITATHIEVPSLIATSIHLTDVACGAIKLALIAESERPRGSDTADIPVARVRAMAGWTAKTLHETIARAAGLRTRWCGQATSVFQPFAAAPRARFDGLDERVMIRFSDEWLVAARGHPVILPLEELRALSWRSGVLLRLRVGGMLADAEKVRFKLDPQDFGLLSGCPEHTPPAAHLTPHVARAIQDITDHSSTVKVDGSVSSRRSGHVTGMWITASRIHQRPLKAGARPRTATGGAFAPAG